MTEPVLEARSCQITYHCEFLKARSTFYRMYEHSRAGTSSFPTRCLHNGLGHVHHTWFSGHLPLTARKSKPKRENR